MYIIIYSIKTGERRENEISRYVRKIFNYSDPYDDYVIKNSNTRQTHYASDTGYIL